MIGSPSCYSREMKTPVSARFSVNVQLRRTLAILTVCALLFCVGIVGFVTQIGTSPLAAICFGIGASYAGREARHRLRLFGWLREEKLRRQRCVGPGGVV